MIWWRWLINDQKENVNSEWIAVGEYLIRKPFRRPMNFPTRAGLIKKNKNYVSAAKLRLLKNSIPTLFVKAFFYRIILRKIPKGNLSMGKKKRVFSFFTSTAKRWNSKFQQCFLIDRKSPVLLYIQVKDVNEAQAWRVHFQALPLCNEMKNNTNHTSLPLSSSKLKGGGGGLTETDAVPTSTWGQKLTEPTAVAAKTWLSPCIWQRDDKQTYFNTFDVRIEKLKKRRQTKPLIVSAAQLFFSFLFFFF